MKKKQLLHGQHYKGEQYVSVYGSGDNSIGHVFIHAIH